MHLKEVCLHPGDCNHIIQQAGSGQILRVYKGDRQVGYGVFSEFFKRYGLPLLKSIGAPLLNKIKKEGLEFGKEVGQNIFINKVNPKEALKRGLKRTVKRAGLDLLEVAHKKLSQLGSGRRKKRRTKTSKKKKRTKKVTKATTSKRGSKRKSRSRKNKYNTTSRTRTHSQKKKRSSRKTNKTHQRKRSFNLTHSQLVPNVFGY